MRILKFLSNSTRHFKTQLFSILNLQANYRKANTTQFPFGPIQSGPTSMQKSNCTIVDIHI